MEPYLIEGDIILVEEVTTNIQVGDLILLDIGRTQKPVIHRLLLHGPKGDGNKNFDQECHRSLKIIGRAVGRFSPRGLVAFQDYGRLLSLWSELNHREVKVFHRLGSLVVRVLGAYARRKELT